MNLTDQFIFILGTTKFDNPYESTTYTLAKYLAKSNYVYYIENPFTWKDYFRFKGSAEFERRQHYFSSASDGILPTEIENLKVVIVPFLLSINFLPEGLIYRALLKINERIIAKRLKKIIAAKNIPKPIYINSFNFHYPNIAKYINPIATVYHCVDPLILPFDRKHGVISEQILLQKSDMVVCTSKQLYTEKKETNPNTYFVPNAADISHCSKALDEDLQVHESIRNLKKPIIGYFGHVERRFDFDLLKAVVEKHSEKTFVFAGPVSREFIPDWFFNTPNIILTGRFDYDQLPSILKGFDVALIPFKKDNVSGTIFPLKLFEYLGAGKPVVCTNFNPDLAEFTHQTVRYCADSETFSEAITSELENDSKERISERIEIANQNTWTKRIDEFANLIYLQIT
ncbi:MAG: glycosyltransferase [Pyrinomonadaceae bacterium]|nr:glycosyltransferase [Sphingobacteriaceae bacterium]